jgi:CDP-diacylglycerol--glycerol-3-phosphate 3-phosphatidyltransferase
VIGYFIKDTVPYLKDELKIGNWHLSNYYQFVLYVFIIAAITDWFDGWVARKFHLYTPAGAFLDAIADKILLNIVLILLTDAKIVPVYVLIIVLCRDFIVDSLRLTLAYQQIIIKGPIYQFGRVKTTIFFIVVVFLIVFNCQTLNYSFASWQNQLLLLPTYCATVYTVVVGVIYFLYAGKKTHER